MGLTRFQQVLRLSLRRYCSGGRRCCQLQHPVVTSDSEEGNTQSESKSALELEQGSSKQPAAAQGAPTNVFGTAKTQEGAEDMCNATWRFLSRMSHGGWSVSCVLASGPQSWSLERCAITECTPHARITFAWETSLLAAFKLLAQGGVKITDSWCASCHTLRT